MNSFKIRKFIFYTFTILILVGQLSLAYWVFKLLHTGSQGFFMAWFVPIVLSFVVFICAFLFCIPLAGGKKHFGWGDWYDTLIYFKSFKKVYHSELGYFVILVTESGVNLYQQGCWRLFYLNKFNLEPELLQNRIKRYLDEKYQKHLKEKKEKDDINSKINKVKQWDGFLDTVGKRDEKINQLLK